MAKKKSTATRRKESQAASERAAAIRKEQERKERRRRSLVVTAVGVVVLAFVLVIGYTVQNSRDTTGQSSAAPAGAAGYAVPVGRSSAPVTVTLYEDFICPFCGEFEAATRTKLQSDVDAGKVKLRYHVLNFLSRSSTTNYSLRAANAEAVVLNAAGPTAAKKFHDLLFENQPEEGSAGLTDARLIDYAVQAGASRLEGAPTTSRTLLRAVGEERHRRRRPRTGSRHADGQGRRQGARGRRSPTGQHEKVRRARRLSAVHSGHEWAP